MMIWNQKHKLYVGLLCLSLFGASCNRGSIISSASIKLTDTETQDIGRSIVLLSAGSGNQLNPYGTGIVLPITAVSNYYLEQARATAKTGNATLSDNIAWVMVKKQTQKALCGQDNLLCPRIYFPFHDSMPDTRVVKNFYTASDPVGAVDLKDQDVTLLLFAKKCLSPSQGGDCWGDREFGNYFSSNFSKSTTFCRSNLSTGTDVTIFSYPIDSLSATDISQDSSTGKITGRIDGGYTTNARVISGNDGGFAIAKIDNNTCIIGLSQVNSITKTQQGVIYTINPN